MDAVFPLGDVFEVVRVRACNDSVPLFVRLIPSVREERLRVRDLEGAEGTFGRDEPEVGEHAVARAVDVRGVAEPAVPLDERGQVGDFDRRRVDEQLLLDAGELKEKVPYEKLVTTKYTEKQK